MFIAPTKWLLLQDRRTSIDDANPTSTYGILVSDIFEDLAVYPDSDVILAQRLDDNFIELTSVYRLVSQRGVISENRGNWSLGNGLQMRTYDVTSARRRNLRRTELKSSIAVSRTCIRSRWIGTRSFHRQDIPRRIGWYCCSVALSLFNRSKIYKAKRPKRDSSERCERHT